MRFLFSVQPATGHLNPVVALALRLQSEGHDVRVASSTSFAPEIESVGLRPMVAGRDWLVSDAANALPELLKLQVSGQVNAFAGLAGELFADLVAHDFRPDLVVRETAEFGAAIYADQLGVPCVVHGIGLRIPGPLLDRWAGETLRDALAEHAPELTLETFAGAACLSHLPRSWVPENTMPFEREHFFQPTPSPAAEDAVLPAWLDERDQRRPVVYATLGTVFNDAPEVFGKLIDAADGQPFDLLLAIGRRAHLTTSATPDNVYIERYVAQDAVLSKVSAVICHGGMGTVMGALRNGLPVCVVPFSADQPFNALRCEQLGCGRSYTTHAPDHAPIPRARVEDIKADALREHMRAIVEDRSYRQAADRVADEIRALPDLDAEAKLVLDLAAAHFSHA